MLLGTLGASILGKAKDESRRRNNWRRWKFLMRSHPSTNFEIQKYYKNEPKFNGVYSGNNLSKIKDEAYIINFDEYESIGANWIALYVNDNNVTYFESFGVERIQKKLENSLGIKIL